MTLGEQGSIMNAPATHRPVVMARRGLVTAAHPSAALAGVEVLRRGGHAVDAAIATNAVLAVVQPHMCGIGGDFFCLIYDAGSQRIGFLNASGRTSRWADRAALTRHGHDEMPFRGGQSITVPGCVDGWQKAWERHGRLPWSTLFEDAVEAAREGFPVTHQLAAWIAHERDVLADEGALQATFLNDGGPPRPGTILRQPALAESLEMIATDGGRAFYGGAFADRLCAGVRAAGGLIDRSDLEEHQSEWDSPISTMYRDTTVVTTGGNTQGLVTLIALNVLDSYPLEEWDRHGFQRIHHSVEALKVAWQSRSGISDPTFVGVPWTDLLSKEHAATLRARIHPERALPGPPVEPRTDTTAFAVADAEGNVVSGIQSLSSPFGAGVMPPGTGVMLHNRGAGFSLDGIHPNALQARKRPLHTLMATMVLRLGRPALAFATMGGVGQPQTHLQVITNIIVDGLDVQEAIEVPRWLLGDPSRRHSSARLQVEPRFPRSTIDALVRAGHDVSGVEDRAFQMRHAHGIVIDHSSGTRMGGADPRGDGYAIGY